MLTTSASVSSPSPSSSQDPPDPKPSSSDPPPPPIPLAWPSGGDLTIHWIEDLITTFDWSSRNLPPADFPKVFPVSVFDSLVLKASKILHTEPNLVKVNESGEQDSTVVVVGDLHGQWHDVVFLMNDAGLPSDKRFFVFNGDYVDRGAWGIETFMLLLAWKVLLPHRVFLLRGNHESKYCTSVYGFEQEVMAKYGDKGKHVYRKCLGCFEGLPLASVIAGRVFTAHGGLFRSMHVSSVKRPKGKKGKKRVVNSDIKSLTLGSLDELSKARRTVLDPPWEGSNLIPGDVLWSDPSMSPGLSPNEERGIGLLWGPDCTEEFLKKYDIKLIIRSHEGPDAREKRPGLSGMERGYTIDHEVASGKLITLFSAPDYPQFQATKERYNNRGAYIVLEPPAFATPVFHSFDAVTPRPKANSYYNYEDVIDSDEELDLVSMVDDSLSEGPSSV
ncbi:Phosphoesterase domain-containing protein [Cinnamomum micranthum f. kanehirae]|uniref:Serine/threonine-protein phosphatase n=1 Tax=Cinnamomum micranthum f. kanehirae TaxID=337451 RepID=A0A443NIE1_9MAGN|nr:Phosphoesterase domain-containing protein [Cinnamomum micranthum f. kanehirae]